MTVSTAVPASAVASVVGIKTEFKDLRTGVVLLPQRVMVVGQGSSSAVYATDKRQVFTAAEAGSLYGFGSPIHLAALQLLPANGDGVGSIPVTIYPLEDAGGSAAASGDITPAGSQTTQAAYTVRVNNIDSQPFLIPVGASVASIVTAMTEAINAEVSMPVIASDDTTEVGLTSKWQGASANDIEVEIVGDQSLGTTFAVTQPTGGATNPDVQTALDQIGDVWETLVVNCLNGADTNALDAFDTFNEGRWGPLTKKPIQGVFHGDTGTDVTTVGTVPDARKQDRTNVRVNVTGGKDLPVTIAAATVARVAVRADSNPAYAYGSLDLPGLTPGLDADQWNYAERDTATKLGVATTRVKDGVVNISDIVTFYHPTGEEPPAHRYVVSNVKLANIIFNLDLIFNSPEWDSAPLIPDDQPTTNRAAKKPFMAKAAIASMLDSLGLEAIISDPETAKTRTVAVINSQNPNRLDIEITVQLSGNAKIISIDLLFGFFFGTQPIVA